MIFEVVAEYVTKSDGISRKCRLKEARSARAIVVGVWWEICSLKYGRCMMMLT